MPPYFFHLAFELHSPADSAHVPFAPAPNLNPFSKDLPVHSSSSWASYIAPRGPRRCPASQSEFRDGSHPPSVVPEHGLLTPADQTPVQTPSRDRARSPVDRTAAPKDWRYEDITIESVDMETAPTNALGGVDPDTGTTSQIAAQALAVKGKYIPSNPQSTNLGVGVVHLYRDVEPSDELSPEFIGATPSSKSHGIDTSKAYVDTDCTTLCILAVPSYMTPSDLLGWAGDETMEHVSHFRLIRTGRSNKYMVLMKFHEAKQAKAWQRNWNGRLFSSMEPENCHVVFVQSIQFHTADDNRDPTNFPDMSNDPFTPAMRQLEAPSSGLDATNKNGNTLTTKPAPPPTPSLLELPTCPVCLERMDETTGLATIFCQHVFHCACLQKWRGSGCPVCRYTQEDLVSKAGDRKDPQSECATCGSKSNLWICLICGNVGCGRYDEAHAFAHYEHTAHTFAMDISTQHIWDYADDEYVHRLIQNKSDGKLVELPAAASPISSDCGAESIPTQKMENLSLEYTHLMTSQLDSQRMYFEEQLERAVDKASKATAAAEHAAERAVKACSRLEHSEAANKTYTNDMIPSLERDKERAERKAQKAESTARSMQNEWREKSVINDSLMDRISHLEKQLEDSQGKVKDLEEQNRDLSFFISGMEKLKDQGSDVQEGTVTVADPPVASGSKKTRKKKAKGTGSSG